MDRFADSGAHLLASQHGVRCRATVGLRNYANNVPLGVQRWHIIFGRNAAIVKEESSDDLDSDSNALLHVAALPSRMGLVIDVIIMCVIKKAGIIAGLPNR